MSDAKKRRAALDHLPPKGIRDKKDQFRDVEMKPYESVDEGTGEVTTRVLADYNAETHKVAPIIPARNIPKKQIAPFVRIVRGATANLSGPEKLIFYELTELITWENNFVRGEDGSLLSISEFSKKIHMSRPHVDKMLKLLQEKSLIRIVHTGKGKASYIYIYSKSVWCGRERNKNDKALVEFLERINTDAPRR